VSKKSDEASPLPEGWLHQFLDTADLKRSFEALRGSRHFYAETMRGRIRSLELCLEEASQHFERAVALSGRAPETIPNLIRQFVLAVYIFDNRLFQAPLDDVTEIPEPWIPQLPEELLREYPEVRFVLETRRAAEGFLRLNLGECEESARIFGELVREPGIPGDVLTMYHLGLAASQYNLGLEEDAMENIESAGFHLQAGGRLLNRARAAGCLYGFYCYLEKRDQAESWTAFLKQLTCPEATKRVFLKRGRLLVRRCAQQGSLVLL